ncbi:MAG: biopolymer transporter ExbD [Planctomycetota bacterium]
MKEIVNNFDFVSSDASNGVKMTPMIDVVFQLLIFLMCSLHFRSLEAVLEARLPRDGEIASPIKNPGPVSEGDSPRRVEIRIAVIHNTGNPLIPLIKLDGRPLDGYNDLTLTLTGIRNKNKDASVVIEPQGDVPTQCVVDAIDACKKAGVVPKLAK